MRHPAEGAPAGAPGRTLPGSPPPPSPARRKTAPPALPMTAPVATRTLSRRAVSSRIHQVFGAGIGGDLSPAVPWGSPSPLAGEGGLRPWPKAGRQDWRRRRVASTSPFPQAARGRRPKSLPPQPLACVGWPPNHRWDPMGDGGAPPPLAQGASAPDSATPAPVIFVAEARAFSYLQGAHARPRTSRHER